jgi:hypothetical protein
MRVARETSAVNDAAQRRYGFAEHVQNTEHQEPRDVQQINSFGRHAGEEISNALIPMEAVHLAPLDLSY